MDNPLVTIGIPTMTRLEYLREAVECVRAQTYSNIEIAIAQDPCRNGPDKTLAAWAISQATRDSRIVYWANSHNLGLAGNWNEIVSKAKGYYITVIGDDDRLLPTFVDELVRAAERNEADVAFCDHWVIDEIGRRLNAQTELFSRRYRRNKLSSGLLRNPVRAVWENSIPMSASMFRTADVKRLRFNDDLNTPEIELHARLSLEGKQYVFVNMRLTEYRVHATSETSAGLRYDRLVEHLGKIAVPPEYESTKRLFMERAVLEAAKQLLKHGEAQKVRELLRNKYYPGLSGLRVSRTAVGLSFRGLVLALLACLPGRIGAAILNSYSSGIAVNARAPRRP